MIGERIQELRETNSLTQTALAKKLGPSRSAINAWERGISVPSTRYAVELAQLFHISADYILEIGHSKIIDISFLNYEDKELVYGLLRHFQRSPQGAMRLDRKEQAQLRADYAALCRGGIHLPDSLRRLAERALEESEEQKPFAEE